MADKSVEKSIRERQDPGGEHQRQAAGLEALLASPLIRGILRMRGVNVAEMRADVGEHRRYLEELLDSSEVAATALSSLGWPFFGASPHDAYVRAAELIGEGKPDEAEGVLVEAWNEADGTLTWLPHRVFSLYGQELFEVGSNRKRLVEKALEHHWRGEYAAAISITLAQIDGVFFDVTGRGAKDFFHEKNQQLLDDETLPGHSLGLMALASFMASPTRTSRATGKLTRHGILHGRELAYDTRENSTKALVGLLALTEWAGPKSEALRTEAKEKRERQYAGSRKVDQWGQRLDRRGFDEAQRALGSVHTFQHGRHLNHGRYAASPQQLDPDGRLLKGASVEICASADGQEYWAWASTPTGVVFGIAGRAGDYERWLYQGNEPPDGGLESGSAWHSDVDPDFPPDW